MALTEWLLLGGAIWALKSISDKDNAKREAEYQEYLAEYKKEKAERSRLEKIEKIRRSVPCNFNEGISYDEFCQIVNKAKKRIKRIKNIQIDGATVLCTAESQTGYSTWDFYVDFNDWGHITGVFWRNSDNTDSNIPKHFEDIVSSEINDLLHSRKVIRNSFANLVYSNMNKTTMSVLGTSYKPKPLKGIFSRKHYINTSISSATLANEHIYIVLSILKNNGFINIKSIPVKDIDSSNNYYVHQVACVTIDNLEQFTVGTSFQNDAEVIIYYHDKREITSHFSGRIFKNQNCFDVEKQLRSLGFSNISLKPMKDLVTGWLSKEYNVCKVYFNGNEENTFKKNEVYKYDKHIVIKYHSFKK